MRNDNDRDNDQDKEGWPNNRPRGDAIRRASGKRAIKLRTKLATKSNLM
ncbi:MAG: hypothetical protein QGH15_21620 [Kiritimatiellia bacterium]|jgi:hypothetical protein|nr:hypothetical protein [Kiritimatiellia bacterium]